MIICYYSSIFDTVINTRIKIIFFNWDVKPKNFFTMVLLKTQIEFFFENFLKLKEFNRIKKSDKFINQKEEKYHDYTNTLFFMW